MDKPVWVVVDKHYDGEINATVFATEEFAYDHAAKCALMAADDMDDVDPFMAQEMADLIKAGKAKEALKFYDEKILADVNVDEECTFEVFKKLVLHEKVHADDVIDERENVEEEEASEKDGYRGYDPQDVEHIVHTTFLAASDGDHPDHGKTKKELWVGQSGEGISTQLPECCAKWMVETINKKYPLLKYRAVEASQLIRGSTIP